VNKIDDSKEKNNRTQSFVKSIFRLMRIPNIFTAVADVMMGFVFMHQSFEPLGGLLFLCAATCCLYSAGMILNDVFDVEIDSVERPERSIPSGAVSLQFATILSYTLIFTGVGCAITSYFFFAEEKLLTRFEPAIIAILLVAAIFLYNKILKKTPVAPIAMGGCRFLNILLGMSLIGSANAGLIPAGLMIALGVGVFVAGFTWFARSEAKESDIKLLTFGFVVMVVGLLLIAGMPFYGLTLPATATKIWLLPFIIGAIGLSVVRLSLVAIADPTPRHVQMTIKQCILSLILINAALCFWVDPEQYQFAFVVLVLLFPAIMLGQWFKST
jgi:4-hydroxybenzoate polyprenyltransferase